MNLRDEQKKVQQAMNASLSGLQEDPWLTGRVLAKARGEEKVGKKKISALVLTVILILALIGTACAVFSSRIAEYFSLNWNREVGERLKEGKIAQIGESVTVGDVVFTLEEIAYRDRALYGIGTVRALNEKDVLVPNDLANEVEYFVSSKQGKEYIAKAKETGGRLLTADAWPREIGVDGGTMLNPGSVGYYDEDNGDGTLTFSFEAEDGFAVNDGTSYQILMESAIGQIGDDGEFIEGTYQTERWTISCEPTVIKETAEPERPAREIGVEYLDRYEVTAPAAYTETGTLPVYRAMETDLAALTDPLWFNKTGIRKQEDTGEGTLIRFNDFAELDIAGDHVWYLERREKGNLRSDSMMILELAGINDWYRYLGQFRLEKKELTGITLEEAQRQAEKLLAGLGLDSEKYGCVRALDMDLERIRQMGAIWEHEIEIGEHFDGELHQPYDYAAIPATEEAYLLEYRPLETDTEDCCGGYEAKFLVNSRGIVYAAVDNQYSRGEIAYTPEKLLTAEDAIRRLAEEFGKSRSEAGKDKVRMWKTALSYEVIRAADKEDGMAFVPVWTTLYLDPDEDPDEKGLEPCYALFNAEDGTLIDATFK